MNTPEVRTQSKPSTAYQELGKFKEELEMKTATLTAKVNMWLHEHLAMKTPIKLLGGLALGVLVMTATALAVVMTYADEPARPLSSGQNPGYCEIDGSCYDPPLLGDLPDPALAAGSPLSAAEVEYWPEVGFDSRTYHQFMVEQGKVSRVDSGKVYADIDDGEAMVIYGYPASIASVFHALKQGKVASPLSSVQFEEWPEVGLDSYTYHRFMVEQGKVGRLSTTKTECYPELQIC